MDKSEMFELGSRETSILLCWFHQNRSRKRAQGSL